MRFAPLALLLTFAFSATGCFHARVETGLAPGNQEIDVPFAHSFIYGLVPPSTVEAASKCPNGVSVVETQISFINGLVSALTFSLYTPMHITVTCAAAGAASADQPQIEVAADATFEEAAVALNAAADEAAATGDAVVVRFND